MSKTIVVTTTIRIPQFLRDLCENVRKYNKQDTSFIVIGDTKTPREIREFCRGLTEEFKLAVDYLDIEAQEKALAAYPQLLRLMPLNSGSRKLIGNFLAYLRGCDRLIMIDDDNFITAGDFFGLYESVGQRLEMPLMQSGSGWYNAYEAVVEARGIPFYPRGYPWGQRRPEVEPARRRTQKLPVIVKNGLVLEDPDIDAISRLFWPIRVVAMKPEFAPHFGLYPGTWTSFNNQNTAISYEVIPVYFTPPSTGRNSDIWTSFVCCRLAEQMQGVVAFGHPLVRQIRNPHNLWRDLDDEVLNDRAADAFVSLLRSVSLKENSYRAALGELIEGCLSKLPDLAAAEDEKEMMRNFFGEYRIWHELFSRVEKQQLVEGGRSR